MIRRIAILAVAALFISAGQAQDVDAAQQKLLAKRAAEADAYRKLAEAVYGLQLNSRTIVRDFVTESDDIRGSVDEFIRGIRLGEPTYFEDGSCEVPAEVTVEKIVETLREVHTRHYKGDHVKASDFESITRRPERKVIKVIGRGAPREDLPPELPEGVAEQLGAKPGVKPSIPDIWRKIGPQARLMATEAARKDAQRRLAERLKGLRLTARTTVRDFVTESDEINTEMNAFLVGAQEDSTYYHHDELIVEVHMVVPTEQVITTIKALHSRHYKGDDVKGADIEKIVRNVVRKEFDATGMGVPPARYVKKYAETMQVAFPSWAEGMIDASGQGTDEEIGSAQGKLRAIRAAELDARRKLAERIAGMQISANTKIDDFVTQHDHIVAELDAVIADARIKSQEVSGDTATVVVEVPGTAVWSMLESERAAAVRRR
ncbi:MAG: LPP20 family lipoprotein [Phycisphaerales bacterium]|nr:LPP20 family lipoprotein [Phycisphaerales bacterium]